VSATDELVVRVDAGGWGLTWAADHEGRLRQVGLGPGGETADLAVEPRWYPEVHPTLGPSDPTRPPALRITHADGTLTTRLVARDVRRSALDDGEHIVVASTDERFDLAVEQHLRTHPASGVLEQWIEVHHGEGGPVRLLDYDSVAPLVLVAADAEVTQFGGSGWADEWAWTTQALTPGTASLTSLGGVQPHLQRSPCLLVAPDGPAGEDDGTVLGLSVAWGGNVRFDLDVRPAADRSAPRELRVRAGANPTGAEYVLDPGVRFVAPTVAWTWSARGRSAVTRSFHAWTRARVLRDPDRLRPIVANNWEATFFDFDEDRLVGLIGRAADVGADLFLLDDGWFGTTHPRDDDTAGLGDWDPDPAKLPRGVEPLSRAARERGIRFGIWVEPEMVNRDSDLFAAHPDWVVRDGREPREHRNQLVLDPLRPEVRDFEVDVVDRTLGRSAGISFLKWDANRPVTDPGSAALAADRQANLWVDLVRATWEVMDRVVAAHPDVELMLCASGGGRTDHGTLRRFHEFWTSDNTDPVTRVRMQWACAHFFPAAAMAAHVTRWGERPMAFAAAVALSGRFGFDLDLEALGDEDLAVCRRAVAVARRTQDLVQQGDLVRLVSPVEGPDPSSAALAHVSPDGDRAVVFAYQLEDRTAAPPALVVPGLDDGRRFAVRWTDLGADDPVPAGERTGADLAGAGLGWPLERACTARIWELTAAPDAT
jgi:alpha-galactosidase